ncbi:type II toxin-antitoxin system YafQ family toxin [Helicobacter sp. MIT 11-5569]|uniref:type II toxin-antitoxin system YafQ family toxin n=1 Tax=Helicobacter sp. MIT 11-5569 TaxID=1548151 RepID=UPI00051FCE15|nr:type II toxin-antitoxin system YafQ family toxin [Helicobacter sp. MIT 11-5569]TLD83263.1 type II toxin-antitoxin system YafQ family toxin [Helicobacter sp. MIT 11-5569]
MAKYKIAYSKVFIKEYKKLGVDDRTGVDEVVIKLENDEALEKRYKDHKLQGEYAGFREYHIKPLIYEKFEQILILNLARVGSHSQLLK